MLPVDQVCSGFCLICSACWLCVCVQVFLGGGNQLLQLQQDLIPRTSHLLSSYHLLKYVSQSLASSVPMDTMWVWADTQVRRWADPARLSLTSCCFSEMWTCSTSQRWSCRTLRAYRRVDQVRNHAHSQRLLPLRRPTAISNKSINRTVNSLPFVWFHTN